MQIFTYQELPSHLYLFQQYGRFIQNVLQYKIYFRGGRSRTATTLHPIVLNNQCIVEFVIQ